MDKNYQPLTAYRRRNGLVEPLGRKGQGEVEMEVGRDGGGAAPHAPAAAAAGGRRGGAALVGQAGGGGVAGEASGGHRALNSQKGDAVIFFLLNATHTQNTHTYTPHTHHTRTPHTHTHTYTHTPHTHTQLHTMLSCQHILKVAICFYDERDKRKELCIGTNLLLPLCSLFVILLLLHNGTFPHAERSLPLQNDNFVMQPSRSFCK